jgi:hypothetical protein
MLPVWIKSRSGILTALFVTAAGFGSLNCLSSSKGSTGNGTGQTGSAGTGQQTGSSGSNGQGQAGTDGQGTSGSNGQGMSGSNGQGMSGSNGQGMAGNEGGGGGGMGGTGVAGTNGNVKWKNYEVTGSFPGAPVAIQQKMGTLHYTKFVVHNLFLAESCSIADYDNDGIPDISSGRMWYKGTGNPAMPINPTGHPFRSGHGVLPAKGDGIELNTGVSDDWADFPWDVDNDGNTDIINVAQCDVPEDHDPNTGQTGGPDNPKAAGTPNKIGTVQVHATAVWYKNPGPAGQAGDPMWVSHLMHSDVRLEQHGMVDMNGDGFPEIYGACKNCVPATTKGYYQGDPKNPTAPWTFHSVTIPYLFPFGGLGWLHGEGAGDVNGDGLPDLLEKGGAWIQQAGGMWNQTPCTGKNTPAGCGWIKSTTPLLPMGYSALGVTDGVGNVGPSNMYAVDMDGDGCNDVVAAEWAHGNQGLWWYQQKKDASGCTYAFNRFQFLGGSLASNPADVTKWGAGFTEPHAMEVYDMDGDKRPDVIVGKQRFAHPHGQPDPDIDGTPYVYVFQNVAMPDSRTGSPITLKPMLVDGKEGQTAGSTDGGMGVGRHFSVGHVNTDGIMDICVGTKVGLAVFLGQ